MGDDLLGCILEMATENVQINFSLSARKILSIFPIFSENSCAGMAIFAILKLLLTISPSIRVILPESVEQSMYSVPVVNK